MNFYEDDKRKAARLLFDAITDHEAVLVEAVQKDDAAVSSLIIGLSLGKVCAARDYLAATLEMPVFTDEAPVEPKRALEVVS